ncbi:MAG: hypothetical protein GTO03_10685 [Planctomycetales bacterium]|nr:hypothetical protein [Planctomycetales bacterium]
MSEPLRIVKLGGSLLDWDGLPRAWHNWLAAQPPARNVLVAGGGRLADQVRYYDQRHSLDATTAHLAAGLTLSVTARLAAGLLGGLQLVTQRDDLDTAVGSAGCVVLDPYAFLAGDEAAVAEGGLPHGWEVTSDSIAARLARATLADELVLLKSALPRRGASWSEVVGQGLIDAYFPLAVAGVSSVRWVNLRDPTVPAWRPPMISS